MRSSRIRRAAIVCGLAACVATAVATAATGPRAGAVAAQGSEPKRAPVSAPIDINSASRKQLKTLPGIGDIEADRIVSGRPYLSKAELATRDVIPSGVYVSLKSRIIAKQKTGRPVKVP